MKTETENFKINYSSEATTVEELRDELLLFFSGCASSRRTEAWNAVKKKTKADALARAETFEFVAKVLHDLTFEKGKADNSNHDIH